MTKRKKTDIKNFTVVIDRIALRGETGAGVSRYDSKKDVNPIRLTSSRTYVHAAAGSALISIK